MKNTFVFTKTFSATYEVTEIHGNRMLTVELPGFGTKTTQLGNLTEKNLANILAEQIISDLEEK